MDTTTSKKAQRLKESLSLRQKALVAAQFEDCVQALQQLCDSLQVNQSDSGIYRASKICVIRFKLWGDASGASSRTLDYALRGSPLLRKQTLRLLGELSSVIKEALEGVLSQAPEVNRGTALPAETTALSELSGSTDFGDEEALDDQDVETGPQSCLEEAQDILEYLVQLLPALREPSEEIVVLPAIQDDDGYSANAFEQLAVGLFPAAPKEIIRRLGETNLRRRQSTQHALGGSKSPESRITPKQSNRRSVPPWNMSFQRTELNREDYSDSHQLTFAGSVTGTSTIRSHMDTVLSRTALPDQDSFTSGTDTPQPEILERLILPPPPVDLPRAEPFDCPYCHCELPLVFSAGLLDAAEWSNHVWHDLKPYTCTSSQCSYSYRPFGDRKQWVKHDMDCHQSTLTWFCGGCYMDFETEGLLVTHIQTSHCEITPDQWALIRESCKRYSKNLSLEQSCVLCGVVYDDIDELQDHIARHQEKFALAVLLEDETPQDDRFPNSDMLSEYIEELPEFQKDVNNPIAANPHTRLDTSYDADSLDTDASLLENTIGPSGPDGSEKVSDKLDNESWNAKVQKFLNKQPSQDPSPPIHSNPRSRYENFVGRDFDMQKIRKHMAAPGCVATVSGRGGIGKTAIAAEYLHKFETDYSYLFWVEAENPGLCSEQYGMIASTLELAEKPLADADARTYLVREYLARTEHRWLLIFDNVTSWADISRYIPRRLPKTQGSVLITTRTGPFLKIPTWYPVYHHQYAIELDVWPLEHAREFLLTSTQPYVNKDNLRAHAEYGLAEKVVELVGRLPLALSMIVGYVKVSRLSLADFLEMWEEKEHIMQKPKRGRGIDEDEGDIDATIDSLWTIGIREVRMNSRRLLDILSFLDPETIPKSLLVGDHKEDYLEFLHSSEALSYRRMITELTGRRLIQEKTTSTGEIAYNIHRLLQNKILQDMEDYGLADAFRKAFRLLQKRFPTADPQQVPKPKNWVVCQEYLPHLSRLRRIYEKNIDSAPLGDPNPVEIAKLFYDAAYQIWSRQSTIWNGLDFLQTAEFILDRMNMASNAKIRADILCITGLLLLNKGCVERRQGSERLDKALQIRKTIYEQSPELTNDVLLQNAANDYALCLLNEHHFEEAGQIFIQCRARYLEWGPESENPFENSKYYGNYSIVLMWRGEMAKAVEYQRRAVTLTEDFTGKKASYYRKVFMLACVLLQAGDLQDALDLHVEVLKERLNLHGKHDEYTMSSMYAVGAMYHHLGDQVLATEYIQNSIQYAKSAWWDRSALCRAQYHLALLYREQGIMEDEAVKLEALAQALLDEYGDHAAQSVQDTNDKMMILDDLQSSFLGRYTGQTLLKHLQQYGKGATVS